MRVAGPRLAYTRFGFSPHAIFRPYFAPGNFIACTVRAGTTFSTTLRPPIRFAEPGSTCSVVTPPARLRGNCASCGHTECSAQTCAVTGLVASLPSLSACPPGAGYTPRCECVSIRPGVTYFPAPSMTTASVGASKVAPTAATLPRRSTPAPLRISGPAAVKMFTFRITVARDGKGRYVLAKGSALGTDRAPEPGAVERAAAAAAPRGAGACDDWRPAQASAARTDAKTTVRIAWEYLLLEVDRGAAKLPGGAARG